MNRRPSTRAVRLVAAGAIALGTLAAAWLHAQSATTGREPASSDPHAGHAMPAPASGDPHAGRAMPAPASGDPHAGHAMPAPASSDPHAGHAMPAPASSDPHAGHAMPAPASGDPHAGHAMPAPASGDPHAGHAMPAPASAASAGSANAERKVLYWYDPMVPDQHFDKPGKSPFMDMQLVPRYADEAGGSSVRIDAGVQANLGIRTAPVELGTLTRSLRVPGTLAWSLRDETVVSARVDGIVSRLQVKVPFEAVARGQPLLTLLAPEWSSARAEAQALAQASSPAARELRAAAQARLRVLGATGRGGADGVVLTAPGAGVVSEILVREGQTVAPGTPLMRINDPRVLWLEAAIPQADASLLAAGTPVEASVDALPGESFPGTIDALLPLVDAATRTQRARIVLANPQGRLAPGMFAQVRIEPPAQTRRPLVPNEALIATGDDSRVIVRGSDGRFAPLRVRTGRSSDGRTEILAGLHGGEQVVVSGQFLLDSEASLTGALQRLSAPAAHDAQAQP
ncbi:efflux RND transporter periplasmic adaptor subunit [Dokdonella sp.]|uniref:efflux RND transporter periplasmic adaptor subunit n=1 Tax=Dokdonella sp. TaxID=2291710 RepID=UPI0027B96F81|nr:efflux RND transporter periplasmic adaptor subunit [Dokdonella sp.]